jgi:hypothetical protein
MVGSLFGLPSGSDVRRLYRSSEPGLTPPNVPASGSSRPATARTPDLDHEGYQQIKNVRLRAERNKKKLSKLATNWEFA